LAEVKDQPAGARRPAVGREIHRWRRERAMTLARVAERSGLNIGYLSQIENEKAMPSLDALGEIAAALDVPVAWLLVDSSPAPRVVRAADRPRAATGDLAEATEVDGGTSRDLCIIEAVVPAGHRTGVHAHAGDEHHVVLSGRWRMTQGEHTVELGPGDYLAWDPSIPHDVENIGDAPASLLIIYPAPPQDGFRRCEGRVVMAGSDPFARGRGSRSRAPRAAGARRSPKPRGAGRSPASRGAGRRTVRDMAEVLLFHHALAPDARGRRLLGRAAPGRPHGARPGPLRRPDLRHA